MKLLSHDVQRTQNADGTPSSQFILHLRFDFHGEPLLVVAMHAKAGRYEPNESKRILHSHQLFTYLTEFFNTEAGARFRDRVVWLGDFNAGPHSYNGQYPARWYTYITEGNRPDTPDRAPDAPKNAIGSHNFKWTSAMKVAQGSEPLLTTCKVRDGKLIAQCIDYIFFSEGLFKVTGYVPSPTPEDLAPMYLPSPVWASDHLAVYAELSHMKPSGAK